MPPQKRSRWHRHFWNDINSESWYKCHIWFRWIVYCIIFYSYFFLSQEHLPSLCSIEKRIHRNIFFKCYVLKIEFDFYVIFFYLFRYILSKSCTIFKTITIVWIGSDVLKCTRIVLLDVLLTRSYMNWDYSTILLDTIE